MRSMTTVLLAAVSAVALAACGGSKETTSSSTAAPATDTAAAEPAPVEPAAVEPAAVEPATIEPATAEATVAPDTGAATHSNAAMTMPETTAAAPDAGVVPAAATAAAGEDYAAFTGDAAAGKRMFIKCLACHVAVQGQNKVGPSLYGIVGRPAGSIAGFAYSAANKNSGITWTEEVMFAYLKNPQAYIPGTKMVFPGLPSGQDRADVIAYLKSVK